MNGKAASLIHEFLGWAGVTSAAEERARKKAWKAMSHRERGKRRKMIERHMKANPTPATRTTGLDRFGR